MSDAQTPTNTEASTTSNTAAMADQASSQAADILACGPYFGSLSLELRRIIWGHVLTSPELGSITLLGEPDVDGSETKGLGLTPAILRASRQISAEASGVLYERNTFGFVISRDKMGHSLILRGKYREGRFPRDFDVNVVPCFKHIKHWKITVNPIVYRRNAGPPRALVNFCQAISGVKVHTLEVNLINEMGHRVSPNSMVRALKPLGFLRNLTKLDIKEIDKEILAQLPHCQPGEQDRQLHATKRTVLVPEERKVELRLLAQGNSSVFLIFKAKDKLMAYAKAFERNETLKAAMEPKFHEASLSIGTSQWSWSKGNSFREHMFKHPVEVGLAEAIYATGRCDAAAFRVARASVLEFLEPQYKRATIAALVMVKFNTVMVTTKGSKFGVKGDDARDICLSATDLVHHYADVLKREMPDSTEALIRQHPKKFEEMYGPLLREKLMRKMDRCVGGLQSVKERKRFMRMVNRITNDMDKQYLEMRGARLALFAHDPTDPECNIDLGYCSAYKEVIFRDVKGPRVSPSPCFLCSPRL